MIKKKIVANYLIPNEVDSVCKKVSFILLSDYTLCGCL